MVIPRGENVLLWDVTTHREPAVVGAAADDPDVMPELICDGIHIHPCMVRNTFRLFGAWRMDSTPWAVRRLPCVEHWLPWQTEPLLEAPRRQVILKGVIL